MKNIVLFILLIHACLSATVKYKLEIKNDKGNDDPIVLVPGVFTKINLVLTSIDTNFNYDETTYVIKFKDKNIVAFDEEIEMVPRDNLVYSTFIGLSCSNSIKEDEYTWSLDVENGDTLDYGDVKIKIDRTVKTKIDMNLLLESMVEKSKNFFSLKNEIYNVDDIEIKVGSLDSKIKFNFKDILIAGFGKRKEEYSKNSPSNHGILFDYPFILNELLQKANVKLNLDFSGDITGKCFEFAKTEFSLDLKTEGIVNLDDSIKADIIYNTEDGSPKFDISNKLKINTVIPVAPVILECEFSLDSSFSNDDGDKNYLKSTLKENVYRTVVTSSGKVEIEMDNLQADTEYYVKCEIRNTSSIDEYINKVIDITIGNFDGANVIKQLLPSRDPNATPQCAKFVFKDKNQVLKFALFAPFYCKYYMKKEDNLLSMAIPSIIASISETDETSATLCVAPSPLYNLGKYVSKKESQFNNRFDKFVEHIKTFDLTSIGLDKLDITDVIRTYDISIDPSLISAHLVDTTEVPVPFTDYKQITSFTFELLSKHSQPIECSYSKLLENENSKFIKIINNVNKVFKVVLEPNVKTKVKVGNCDISGIESILDIIGDDKMYSLYVKCENLPNFLHKYETTGTMNLYTYYNSKKTIDQKDDEKTDITINCNEKKNKLNPRCIKEKVVSIVDRIKTEIPEKIKEIEIKIQQFISATKSAKEKIIAELKEEFEKLLENAKTTKKELIEKATELLKYLTYYDCSIYISGSTNKESESIKAGVYLKCRETKQNIVERIINVLREKLQFDNLVTFIKSTEHISDNIEENLKYLLFLVNELTNNPESFTKETSEFIIELVECFETKFNEYWPVVEDYLRKKKKYLELSIKAVKKDVENIILKTLENLAQLIHFDQLDGYIATAQEEIKKTGLIVCDKAKHIYKKIIEFSKRLNEFGSGNYTFSGSMFANIDTKEINVGGNGEIKVRFVNGKDIVVLTNTKLLLNENSAYALQTLVFDSPIVSVNATLEAEGTSDTVNTFVSITLYDKNGNEISIKNIEEAIRPKILYLKEKYQQLKACYFYDENNHELYSNGLELTEIEYEGKLYFQCSSSHLTSFTAGTFVNQKEETDDENEGSKTLMIVLIVVGVVLLLIIIAIIICCIVKRRKSDIDVDKEIDSKEGLVGSN